MSLRLATLALLAAAFAASPAAAQRGNGNGNGNGPLPPCGSGKVPDSKNPNCLVIALTIESDIDFGRLVLLGSGAGQVWLDLATGQRFITGGLDQAGGMPVIGRATITGSPLRPIRVDMPAVITMSDPSGGQAELRDFRTSLPAAPILDSTGQLSFTFSGTLQTGTGIAVGGRLRGRVPITVSYE